MQDRPSVEDVLALDHHWYHCVDLAPGVATPGWIDLRPVAGRALLPLDLRGLRALDIGTYDGFWAFEMERRGADVVAIDIDVIPPPDTPERNVPRVLDEVRGRTPGAGFAVLKDFLGSAVDRRSVNVYDLDADAVDGPVDVVFIGAMLLHLRNPVGALEQVRRVLRPGGRLVLLEPIDPKLSRKREPLARFLAHDTTWTWWYPNLTCLRQWVETAGFADVETHAHLDVTPADGPAQRLVPLSARA